MSEDSFLTLAQGVGLAFGSATWDSSEIRLTECAIEVRQMAERTATMQYSDLAVYECEAVAESYAFSDWLSDFLSHPILSLPALAGIGQERRRLRLEVAERPSYTPLVALVDVPDGVPGVHLSALCILVRTLAQQPELGRAVTHPEVLETLLVGDPSDTQEMAALLQPLAKDPRPDSSA